MLRAVIAALLDLYGGGRGLFVPVQSGVPGRVGGIAVLAAGSLPTTDIYLRARLSEPAGLAVDYIDVATTAPFQQTFAADTLVVLVRHIPRHWLKALARQRAHLAGVIFLVDDDIPGALRAQELPFFYALKTAWRYAATRRSLQRLCSEIWVSTDELARRYPCSMPRVLAPIYLPSTTVSDGESAVYFYHGTWAHRREMEWLVPVVREVQARVPHAWFEIMGGERVRRMFRGIPRVRVMHPMSWSDYLAYAGTVRYQVGLAPCLDSDFNRARSHVKLFDITRLGAVGVYSNVVPYAGRISHGQTGYLVDNTRDAWVTTIGNLLSEQRGRESVFMQARAWCEQTRSSASGWWPPGTEP